MLAEFVTSQVQVGLNQVRFKLVSSYNKLLKVASILFQVVTIYQKLSKVVTSCQKLLQIVTSCRKWS